MLDRKQMSFTWDLLYSVENFLCKYERRKSYRRGGGDTGEEEEIQERKRRYGRGRGDTGEEEECNRRSGAQKKGLLKGGRGGEDECHLSAVPY